MNNDSRHGFLLLIFIIVTVATLARLQPKLGLPEDFAVPRVAVDGVALGDRLEQVVGQWGDIVPTAFWWDGEGMVRAKVQPEKAFGPFGERSARVGVLQRVLEVNGRSLTIGGRPILKVGDPQELVRQRLGDPVRGLVQSRARCGNQGPIRRWSYRCSGRIVSVFTWNPESFDKETQAKIQNLPPDHELLQVVGISLQYPATSSPQTRLEKSKTSLPEAPSLSP